MRIKLDSGEYASRLEVFEWDANDRVYRHPVSGREIREGARASVTGDSRLFPEKEWGYVVAPDET
jgi:hypothetical protein